MSWLKGKIAGGFKVVLGKVVDILPFINDIQVMDLSEQNAEHTRQMAYDLKGFGDVLNDLGDFLLNVTDEESPGGEDVTLGEIREFKAELLSKIGERAQALAESINETRKGIKF